MRANTTFLIVLISLLFSELLHGQAYAPVQAIFNARCSGCHGGNGGVTLTPNATEASILAQVGNQCGTIVVRGSAATSPLVSKIDPSVPICAGSQMPFGGPLPAADIAAIRAWIDALSPLAVDLTYFDIENKDDKAELSWQTSTEVNNDKFEIEYAYGQVEFQIIKTIQGAGNAQTQHDYSFTHTSPHIGLNYYRLKQVDTDGAISYSDVKTLKIDELDFQLFPNPAYNQLSLRGLEGKNISVKLFDLTGRAALAQNLPSGTSHKLNISSLSPGLFIIEINLGDAILRKRFLKQ